MVLNRAGPVWPWSHVLVSIVLVSELDAQMGWDSFPAGGFVARLVALPPLTGVALLRRLAHMLVSLSTYSVPAASCAVSPQQAKVCPMGFQCKNTEILGVRKQPPPLPGHTISYRICSSNKTLRELGRVTSSEVARSGSIPSRLEQAPFQKAGSRRLREMVQTRRPRLVGLRLRSRPKSRRPSR